MLIEARPLMRWTQACRGVKFTSLSSGITDRLYTDWTTVGLIDRTNFGIAIYFLQQNNKRRRWTLRFRSDTKFVTRDNRSIGAGWTTACSMRLFCYITMTSLWVRWRLKSPASPVFVQLLVLVQIKDNTKLPRHWSLCEEFTGDRWIPCTPNKGQ